jgi:hypothetical protein
MKWEKITIQRAENGFVIRIGYPDQGAELWVTEKSGIGVLEALRDVLVSKTD